MERVTIENIPSHVDEQVMLAGWLYYMRRNGNICFPILRDGTGVIQCVSGKTELGDELFDTVCGLTQESSITITGTVRKEERALGGYEIDVVGLEVMQRVPEKAPFPITPKEHEPGFLLDHRHLWLRSRRQSAIQRVRAEIDRSIREYFDNEAFTQVNAPVLTTAITGDSAEAFATKYFDKGRAYLSQSAQLYLEAAATALGKVYCLGPVFSAGREKTQWELAESWLAEAEMPFATLSTVAFTAEDLVKFVIQGVLEKRGNEMNTLERETETLSQVVATTFHFYTYEQAVGILGGFGSPTQAGQEISVSDEALLMADREEPLMIAKHPMAVKSVTIEPASDPLGAAQSLDILAPDRYGVIVTGGERIRDLGLLQKRIADNGLKIPEWYLDLRKYGPVPMAGFSLSIDRLTAWICGIEHAYETALFPRTADICRP